MKPRVVLSIPHTGTRSVMELFDCGHVHTYVRTLPSFSEYWPILQNSFVIVPLRNPRHTWESWVKRWNSKQGEVPLHLYQEQWEHLQWFNKRLRLWYIPVEILPTVSGHISDGVDDYYDPAKYDQPDWDMIYNLPFVKRYYALSS